MVSTGLKELDELLGSDGYPDKSAILIVGPPGIGKEALGYRFTQSGLVQNDFCLYVTRLSSREVLHDVKGFGIDFSQRVPLWYSTDREQMMKFDVNNLAGISYNIKEILKTNADRRIRVVTDITSSLLMLNPPDTIYKFLTQLLAEIKQYDIVFLATLEDGMHDSQVLTAMQALFDGVLELRIYDEGGLSFVSILKILKMIGVPPQTGYFSFSFSQNGMEISAYAKHV